MTSRLGSSGAGSSGIPGTAAPGSQGPPGAPSGIAIGSASWTMPGAAGVPLVIAHRGASALAPENSVEAFERAVADGADGVELDVLCCASGEVIVFHDDDLARLGDQATRIASMSLTDVRAVRLRSGATIPTLDEVLDACGEALLVNVELKAAGATGAEIASLVDAVARVIRRRGPAHAATAARILVSSFNPRAVYRWQQRVPEVRAGLLFERASALPLRRAWALPLLRPFSVHPERVLCTPESVRGWHTRGYRIAVWTVDEAAELRRLAALGVDAIITNDPARARRDLIDSGST